MIPEWMVHAMDEGFELELKKIVKPYLYKGRSGDYEHTLRAVEYGKELLLYEKGDRKIVIPALYLHDIGWSLIDFEDFINISSPRKKCHAASVELHMKEGAAMARRILEKMGYCKDATQSIVSIIAVHDRPERMLAMEIPSATIVFEADYLDKFGLQSLYRFETMFKMNPMTAIEKEKRAAHLRKGLNMWFMTGTAKRMALQLAEESGLVGEII